MLLDDGTIGDGRPLLVNSSGHPEQGPFYCDEEKSHGYPLERLGDRYLCFLIYLPEHQAYQPTLHEYSRLVVDGDGVMYSSVPPPPVPFATGTPPSLFVDAVATAIATVYPPPTPWTPIPLGQAACRRLGLEMHLGSSGGGPGCSSNGPRQESDAVRPGSRRTANQAPVAPL